jgi:hypothetical protein
MVSERASELAKANAALVDEVAERQRTERELQRSEERTPSLSERHGLGVGTGISEPVTCTGPTRSNPFLDSSRANSVPPTRHFSTVSTLRIANLSWLQSTLA